MLAQKLRHLFHRHVLRGRFLSNGGYCWTAHLPGLRHLADSPDTPHRSPLMLYENDVPLVEAHALHEQIRTEGNGLFSHWQDSLFFSTSDNSDPNTNGRRYSYTASSSCELTGSFFKHWPRLWYRIEEMQMAYLHPRLSEEFFRRYLREREKHPGYQLACLAREISMLHEDVLMLLRLFVIASRGVVLEIGSYIGGATILLAATAREFKKGPVISIEPGGAHTPPFAIPSTDICSDLVRNVEKAGIASYVTLLRGFSHDPKVVESVKQATGKKRIGLLIIDADGNVERDFGTYRAFLKTGAIVVIDDYTSKWAPEKAQPVKKWVDESVSSGALSPLGVWGWGTWVGVYTEDLSDDRGFV